MIKVVFVCVHNSCRSQIAEALGKALAGDVFESFSGGTQLADHINPDAVRIFKSRYGIDMTSAQKPKLLDSLPPVDVVITMGCNVICPFVPCRYQEDWDLEDPTGKGDPAMMETIEIIRKKILILKKRIAEGTLFGLNFVKN
jgi:arsenate reductase